jgi:cyanophycin synthetase
VDGLYTATELNETAYEAARDWIEGGSAICCAAPRAPCATPTATRSGRACSASWTPREHGTPVVLDDDTLTLGTGALRQSWDLYELPHPDDVSWRRLRAVPTVLVTGTNGKTTTVRLLAAIARAAGAAPV